MGDLCLEGNHPDAICLCAWVKTRQWCKLAFGPLSGEFPGPMAYGSRQFTPKQLLDAGRRAEAEGRLDLAHRFYGHLSDHYGQVPEAAEGRDGLARIGTGSHYPQVWQMNGVIPTAGAPRARHVALRVEYRVGRALAALASGIGCLAIVAALLGLAAALAAEFALVPALQEHNHAYNVLPRAAGALLAGAVTLLCGQMARALFDRASAARELVAIERAKANLERS